MNSLVKVYQQVEGEAGFALIGTVSNDASAEQVEKLLGITAARRLFTVTRKIDGEISWLVKLKSTDPITRSKFQRFEDLSTICAFLGWGERDRPELTFGGHGVTDVIDAWCRISGITRDQINSVLDSVAEEIEQ